MSHIKLSDMVCLPNSDTNTAILLTIRNTEMVRITPDGFWIRGVKVPVDDEVHLVYNALKEFVFLKMLTEE
jgi:hypothetical protein